MEGNREREKEGGMREQERGERDQEKEGGREGVREGERQRTKEKDRKERKTERGKGEGGIAT